MQTAFHSRDCVCAKSANTVPGTEGDLHTSHLLQSVLVTLWPKIPIRYLRPDGSNSKILTWREYFALELYASGAKSFFPGFFIRFGRPTAENSDLALSTEKQGCQVIMRKIHINARKAICRCIKNKS